MKTPVNADKEQDAKELELSYHNPQRFDHKKMFPNTNWEFEKLDKVTIKGLVGFSLIGFCILAVFFTVVIIGRGTF
jgi:hypothetical protein